MVLGGEPGPTPATGIYISGASRSCTQANLTATWVANQINRGWHLIPIELDNQAPCGTRTPKMSYDPATGRSQGATRATSAAIAATSLGIPAGSVIYNDIEHYPSTESCRAANAPAVAGRGGQRASSSTSGAEAVETAIKIARVNGRHRLVSMHSGYHGKTTGALSLTARSLYQDPFRPLLPDVAHVRFGDLDELAAVVDRDVCVVVEPVQSEGGVVIPEPGYLKAVEALCRDRGAMLVLDEVMTGLGRLGTWWGADRDGVRPDILLVGKALSGGLVPVAATLATAAAFAPLDKDPYLHTSTFSAAPITMAAVRATVEVIRDEGLVDRAGALGARLLAALTEATGVIGHLVAEVRGVGLLIGVEFRAGHHAAEFLMDLLDNHVVVNHSMNAHPVLRLTPPATMTADEEARLIASFTRACAALAARFPATTTGPTA
ncbi:aminotransferase class III-fold pyridoxal phosphate-dependent enzyme [Micromonospora inyonensis]|uniref:Putrescine aminotransferase n=1 Tax=Micromonospora inyonensis TaxID=47866 RepID=A0A1C6S910_9ACTN|nr:aminotransferase class III-fold pyridoxal phosphate-dependent enzyme [Micromonospora inyonensis]SCL25965.1 putrescine aminotransferase [Micromonospora inyonensis]